MQVHAHRCKLKSKLYKIAYYVNWAYGCIFLRDVKKNVDFAHLAVYIDANIS